MHTGGGVEALWTFARRAASSFDDAGDPRGGSYARVELGHAGLVLGELEAAASVLLRALADTERRALHHLVPRAKLYLGPVLAGQGAVDAGREAEQAAVEAFEAQKNTTLAGEARRYLARILLAAGELEAAEREAELAVEALAMMAPVRAHALGILAEVRLARGRGAEALLAARAATDILASPGAIEEADALVRLVWAEALSATGAHAEARTALADARSRLAARAAVIADASLRKSFLERVPENARTLALEL